jgi:hypothetical protein
MRSLFIEKTETIKKRVCLVGTRRLEADYT